jgi:hypothetical protein
MLGSHRFGIYCFHLGYAQAMRVMARRACVLHGQFIESDERSAAATPSLLAAAIRAFSEQRLTATRHWARVLPGPIGILHSFAGRD